MRVPSQSNANRAEPRRLSRGDDRAAELLRAAEPAYLAQLAERAAWQRFQSRKTNDHRTLWLLPALVCAAVALFARGALKPSAPSSLAIAPERSAPFVPTPLPPAQHAVTETHLPAALDRRIPPTVPLVPPAHTSKTIARAAAEPVLNSALDEATCRAWSSQGHFEQAVTCFYALGRGTGLQSEVALYEAARLCSESLNDSPRALALLEEHSRRFPSSALRGEVEWMRVRNLERAGRLDDALTESERLLAEPLGRPLASKLHLLRGRIYQRGQRDCARAVREYVALLGEPGEDGDTAELERARCFEQLGQVSEARAAYQHYLTRTDARNETVAVERLRALASPLEGQGP